jgi:hypothetical protein
MLNSRPLLSGTIQAAGAITELRFIGFDGNQASAQGQKVRGVAHFAGVAGDQITVDEVGSAIVEAGGVIAAGDPIITDNVGRAIKAASLAIAAGATAVTSAAANGANDITGSETAEYRIGRAWSAASAAGQFIEIMFGR